MTKPIRVLHVEDEPEFADLTGSFLRQEIDHIEIDGVESAQEATTTLSTASFDCIVSDYDMPGMNGIELLKEIRSDHEDLPFILFTGKGSEEIASDAISAGVTDYLQKGPGRERFEILANQIVNAVEKMRASREAQRMKARFESLSGAFPDIAFYIDEDGEYLDVLAGEESNLLYDDADQLIGARFHDVLEQETADRFLDTIRTAIETGQVQSIEYKLEVLAGTRWFEGRIAPIDDVLTEDSAVIWVARDVTERKSREEELEITRRRYEAILEQSSDFVLIVDRQGIVTYASPAVERVMGYSPQEVIDGDAFSFVHEDDYEIAINAFESLLEDPEEEVSVEFRAMGSTGETIWLEVRGRFLHDEPSIDGMLINARDISDQRRPELELQEMQQRFDLALEGADAGVWEWNVETGDLVWSDELLGVLGLTREDFIGDIEFFQSRVHPDDEFRGQEAIDSALENGELYRTEQRLRHADGHYVWFEVRGRVVEERDDDTVVGIGIDISDRKRKERELERYRNLVETAGDGIYELDTDGCFTFVNDALVELSGYDRDDLIGAHGTILMSEEDFERGTELIQSLLSEPHDRDTFEMDIITADGETIPCSNHITIIVNDGEFRGTAGVVRDITERKEREEMLSRQNERLEEFARVVSHDLRNPLNVAIGRLELAQEENPPEHLEPLGDSLERMEDLIDDLMALATAGEDISDMEPVDIETVATSSWRTVETKEASLVVDTEATIVADRSRLHQLFENLMRNAVEHGGPRVTVTIGGIEGGFYVEDDGPGIPEADREHVLEAGFSTSTDGTGSGLHIVKQIADGHDWELELSDSATGGARFEVSAVDIVA